LVDGGMHRLASSMADLAQRLGADLHFNTHVSEVLVKGNKAAGVRLEDGTTLPADVVVFNGDSNALATGQLGQGAMRAVKPRPAQKRGLSALTWCIKGSSSGFDLDHHNVFFESNYPSEFNTLFRDRCIPKKTDGLSLRAGSRTPSSTQRFGTHAHAGQRAGRWR
jgi:1-hydroxycarotenoid 3,4-desaturase